MTGGGGRGPSGLDAAAEVQLRHRAKQQIRKSMQAVRRTVPADARARRSARIAEHVRGLGGWTRARVVAGYVAMRGEVDPAALLDEVRGSGRMVVLPRVDVDAQTLELRRVDDGVSLEESAMGFLQPPASAPRVDEGEVDLVLVPALAADERGYRIGWGKGFYDRLLPLMPRATRVALVFDFQLVAEVPETPGDEPVDVVVTDTRVVEPSTPRG